MDELEGVCEKLRQLGRWAVSLADLLDDLDQLVQAHAVGSRAGVAFSCRAAVPVDTQHRRVIPKHTATGFDHGLGLAPALPRVDADVASA